MKYALKDLCTSLKLLLCNATFILLVMADGVDMFLLNGFVSFAPKYLEQQFGVTASQASIYAGGYAHSCSCCIYSGREPSYYTEAE